MITYIFSNKNVNQIVTELFIKKRRLNISPAFVAQSCFAVPKKTKLHSIHYVIMKIPNKREIQQITLNYSSNVEFRNFMSLYKKCNADSSYSLVIGAILASHNHFHFRKNLLEEI